MFLLLACTQPDLTPEWSLDRLRLLAIRAEPAEPRPGDTVTFTSLVYSPEPDWQAVWFACLEGSSQGCEVDLSALEVDPSTLSDEELKAFYAKLLASGLVGFEPYLPPTWVVPKDALADVPAEERNEGISATVQVSVLTEADTELVLKAVPVSEALTPNHNPDIERMEADGVEVGKLTTVSPGSTSTFTAWLAGGREVYTYVSTEGVEEQRTEEPSWRWYTTGGTLSGVGAPDLNAEPTDFGEIGWTAPDSPGTGLLVAVVLDGRGGMGWWSVPWEVR